MGSAIHQPSCAAAAAVSDNHDQQQSYLLISTVLRKIDRQQLRGDRWKGSRESLHCRRLDEPDDFPLTSKLTLLTLLAVRHADAHLLRRRRQDFADGAFHHHGIREVHQMRCNRGLLHPERHVEHTFALHSQRLLLVVRPSDRRSSAQARGRRTALPRMSGRGRTGSRQPGPVPSSRAYTPGMSVRGTRGKTCSIGRSG